MQVRQTVWQDLIELIRMGAGSYLEFKITGQKYCTDRSGVREPRSFLLSRMI